MSLVFSAENLNPDEFDQFLSEFVASCRICFIVIRLLLRHKMEKSSAYSIGMIGFGVCLEMSLMASRKRVTEIEEP
jgi:hypothetical protein